MAEPVVRVSAGVKLKAQIVGLLRNSLDAEMISALRWAMEVCVLNAHKNLNEEILLCGILMRSEASRLKLLTDKERTDDMFRELCPNQPPVLEEKAISNFFLDRKQPEEEEISRILLNRRQLDDSAAMNSSWVQLDDNVILLLWEAIKIASIDDKKAGPQDVLRAMTFHEELLDRLYRQRGIRFRGMARLLSQS